MIFERIKTAYRTAPEFAQSDTIRGEILSRCNDILKDIDRERQNWLNDAIKNLSQVPVDITIKDQWENKNLWWRNIDILLDGSSLSVFLPKWVNFIVHPEKPLAYSVSSNVIYIPESMLSQSTNLHFLVALTHEIGHSLTKKECKDFSVESLDKSMQYFYPAIKDLFDTSSIQEKWKFIWIVYRALRNDKKFIASILKVRTFLWQYNRDNTLFIINRISWLWSDWHGLHEKFEQDMKSNREDEIVFDETIAWKQSFQILENLWQYNTHKSTILQCAEWYLGWYLLRSNRFHNISWSLLDPHIFHRNIQNWRFSFT